MRIEYIKLQSKVARAHCPKNDFFREVIGSPEEIGLAREFRSIDQSSAEILTKEIYQPINLYF